MPSPFPGMDPYLEDHTLWPDVHNRFISVMGELLLPALRPAYFVQIEERVYVTDEFDPARKLIIPDLAISETHLGSATDRFTSESGAALMVQPVPVTVVIDEEIHEPRLEIIDVGSRKVVTVIELLSPANKVPGSEGMRSFADKRKSVLLSDAHWIEIDLLRGGGRIPINGNYDASDYRVHLSRTTERPQSWVWQFSLSQRLPKIPIPLRQEHAEAELDLQSVLNLIYERAGYDLILNYLQEPRPPFRESQLAWAAEMLNSQRSQS